MDTRIQLPVFLSAVSFAAIMMGCGTTATITRSNAPDLEARIRSSDSQNVYIENAGGATTIARESITDIDHPGNVAATIGAVVTGYGIMNIATGAPDCDIGGPAYCFGVFLPAAIGVPILAWGFATWSHSVSAVKSSVAKNHKGPTGPSFAVVPTISVDKKNEYVGVNAAMKF